MDLIEFLNARLDEDEAAAGALGAAFGGTEWMITENGDFDYSVAAGLLSTEAVADLWREDAAAWVARHDPAHMLREIEAKRKLMATADQAYYAADHYASDQILSALAEIWSGHPDYRLAVTGSATTP